MIRLDKYLANKALCTRSQAQAYIKNNDIIINNKKISKKNHPLSDQDEIFINQEKYIYEEKVYFLMNKPQGYICSNKDELYPSVLNLLNKKDYQFDLFTVGRLDVDTTGVLLITNDGAFSHSLLHPQKHVNKTYLVTLKSPISKNEISHLEKGVIINNGYLTKPAKVELITQNCIRLEISEGKYHQVKEMLKSVQNEVVSLHRENFGNYFIDFDEIYIKL